jgi:hypothetical protein
MRRLRHPHFLFTATLLSKPNGEDLVPHHPCHPEPLPAGRQEEKYPKMAEIWLEFRKMWARGFKRASLQPHKFSGLDAKWPFAFNLLSGWISAIFIPRY